MYAIEEVASPAFGLRGLLVVLVVRDERLLLVGIGLEEEAADLVKGAAQPRYPGRSRRQRASW
jgi:hypothetical protein